MSINASTRKKMENLIYGVLDRLDKTGLNTKKYRDQFRKMNDKAFSDYMTKFLKNPDTNFRIEVLPFKNEPEFSDIESAAKFLGIPLEEYVYWHDETANGKPVRSYTKVPVGYIQIKRLQQTVSHKTGMSFDIKERNAITNQVTGGSKTARNSDVETYALLLEGNDNTLKEFLGPRADNAGQKRAMYNTIARDGYVRLKDIQANDSVFEKSTLNTFDVFLMGAGLKSDLVTDGSRLPVSIKGGLD